MSDILMFVIIFSGVWTLVGVVFIIVGIVMFNNKRKKEINCTSSTYGKVIDIVHRSYSRNGGYSSSWHPVFEYNVGELKLKKESPFGSSQSRYAIGQDIQIYYNPENYNEYYIAGDSLPNTLVKIFTFVGIGAIIIGIISAIIILKIIN